MRLAMPFARPLVEGFRPNDRRNWERDLLARYLELFSERTGTRPDFDESFLTTGNKSFTHS